MPTFMAKESLESDKPWEVEAGDHILLFFSSVDGRKSLSEIGLSLEDWEERVIDFKQRIEIVPTTVFTFANKDGSARVVIPPDCSGKLRVSDLIFRWRSYESGFVKKYLNIAGDTKDTNWHRTQFCLELPKETSPDIKTARYEQALEFYRQHREAVWCAIFEKCDAEKEKIKPVK